MPFLCSSLRTNKGRCVESEGSKQHIIAQCKKEKCYSKSVL